MAHVGRDTICLGGYDISSSGCGYVVYSWDNNFYYRNNDSNGTLQVVLGRVNSSFARHSGTGSHSNGEETKALL